MIWGEEKRAFVEFLPVTGASPFSRQAGTAGKAGVPAVPPPFGSFMKEASLYKQTNLGSRQRKRILLTGSHFSPLLVALGVLVGLGWGQTVKAGE